MLLDESVMQTMLTFWSQEKDADSWLICVNDFWIANCINTAPLMSQSDVMIQLMEKVMAEVGFDPTYYMEIDFPSNQSYDVYQTWRKG